MERRAEQTVRVVVAAEYPAMRAGLRAMLAAIPGLEVVAELTLEALDGAGWPADVDAAVVSLDGDESLSQLEETLGRLPAVVLAATPQEYRGATLTTGAPRGYLLQHAGGEEIAAALQAVVRGLIVLDPAVAAQMQPTPAAPRVSADEEAGEPLTEREREVLRLLALGLPNKAIALRLGISEHTVKFHVGAILAKLGAASRTEAVMVAARRGLLPL
jgi:DNA-binding NarL/FixJ family response regulator